MKLIASPREGGQSQGLPQKPKDRHRCSTHKWCTIGDNDDIFVMEIAINARF